MSENRVNELGLPPASPDQQYLSQGPLGPISLRSVIDPSLTSISGTGANQLLKAQIQKATDIALAFGPGTIGAWHGTGAAPFTRFSNEAIGTGEGAQAYGMGHYVAGERKVAESYMPDEGGSLLHVNIKPDHEEFLDWDLPFDKQEPGVQEKLTKLGLNPAVPGDPKFTGEAMYSNLQDRIYDRDADAIMRRYGVGTVTSNRLIEAAYKQSEAKASAVLHEAGIPGNRFVDQFSRKSPAEVAYYEQQVSGGQRALAEAKPGTADWLHASAYIERMNERLAQARALQANPTYNYVVFHPDNIEIKTRDGIPLEPVDYDPFK